jgi:hypothetical protein
VTKLVLNLYDDDFQDEALYSNADILQGVRSILSTGETERSVLDYKRDISDTWPDSAAAFANAFGGILLFGVHENGGVPTSLAGFDPQGKETKTRLVNSLLSRIQPIPDFRIRVVPLDTDPSKQVAVLRIFEGSYPPYVYSNGQKHRIYVRIGAQRAEADYLQISALFEKRKNSVVSTTALVDQLTRPQSRLVVHDPVGSLAVGRKSYRFVIAPRDERAARRLTLPEERLFESLVIRSNDGANPGFNLQRDNQATYFRAVYTGPIERILAVSSSGTIGFTTAAGLNADGRFFFYAAEFCEHLIRFLQLARMFYSERRYFGGGQLEVELKLLDPCVVFSQAKWLEGRHLFEPRLENVSGSSPIKTSLDISMSLQNAAAIMDIVENIVNEIARSYGSVFNPDSRPVLAKHISLLLGRDCRSGT